MPSWSAAIPMADVYKTGSSTSQRILHQPKTLPNGGLSVENQSHRSLSTQAVKPETSSNDIKELIILRWWAIQTMLLSTYMTYILARLNLTVKLSTRPQSTLRWLPTMDSLNQMLPIIPSLLSPSRITLTASTVFGAWVIISLNRIASSTITAQTNVNYSYPFWLSGAILLPVLMS